MMTQVLLGGLLVLGGLFGNRAGKGKVEGTTAEQFEFGGRTREYRIHVPDSYNADKPTPVVFAFHGGKSNFEGMERFTGFSGLSDREGFIVIYPNAVDENWNDGRGAEEITSQRENVDDVGFVAKILEKVSAEYNVDPKRVYATGISNGGMMSHRIGAELSDKFAAIAPVAGGIAKPFASSFRPKEPVSVMIIQGVDDPIVQFAGGFVKPKKGQTIATEDAVEMWVKANGCGGKAKVESVADRDPDDGCTATRHVYSCEDGASVVYYKVEGMGHTWPGGRQYAPKMIIGKVCNDFDATRAIWDFFKSHPKK